MVLGLGDEQKRGFYARRGQFETVHVRYLLWYFQIGEFQWQYILLDQLHLLILQTIQPPILNNIIPPHKLPPLGSPHKQIPFHRQLTRFPFLPLLPQLPQHHLPHLLLPPTAIRQKQRQILQLINELFVLVELVFEGHEETQQAGCELVVEEQGGFVVGLEQG